MDELKDVDSLILLVDDEEHFLRSMYLSLQSEGISNIERCQYSSEVMPLLKKKYFPIIFLDILMPHPRGDELLPKIIENYPDILVIMLTAVNEDETAKKCLEEGAFDYLVKPILTSQIVNSVKNALKFINAFKENIRLKETIFSKNLNHPEHFKEIITINQEILDNLRYIEAIAESPEPILITGETGVGKQLIAKAIHKASRRKGKFIDVNVAGLDDTLFSDTLFGHKKGAFTGAIEDKEGFAAAAQNGTLFLDEIGDLEKQSQIKLLKFIESRKYYRLGDIEPKKTNAHIVLATNQDLDKLIEEEKFRRDLYHRLQIHRIHIPPLRERERDIPILVEHFIKKSSRLLRKRIPEVPEQLYDLLLSYNFTGNVRELEGLVHDAVSRSQEGILLMEPLIKKIEEAKKKRVTKSEDILNHKFKPPKPTFPILEQEVKVLFIRKFPTFKQMERIYLERALELTNGNKSEAASLAALKRSTYINKLNKSRENSKSPDLPEEKKELDGGDNI